MMSNLITQNHKNNISSKLISHVKGLSNAVQTGLPDGLFGRSLTVKTGNLTFDMDQYDIEVNSEFDDTLISNETEISIYNLTSNTIASLKNGQAITVSAGYKEDVGVIFVGFIDKVKTEFDNNDKKTTIYALDKIYSEVNLEEQVKKTYGGTVKTKAGSNILAVWHDALGRERYIKGNKSFPAKSYKVNTKASYILKELLNMTSVPIAVFKIKRDHTYTDAVSLSGSLADNIKKYSEVCGVSTYINNGKLYCKDVAQSASEQFTIDVGHGLVESVEEFEEEVTVDDITDVVAGVKLKTLLNHRINVGSILNIKSINKSGRYVVKKCNYTINDSDFYSEIEAVASN